MINFSYHTSGNKHNQYFSMEKYFGDFSSVFKAKGGYSKKQLEELNITGRFNRDVYHIN